MLARPPQAQGFELSPIKAMELAASKIPGVISLAQGIPSFKTPEVIKRFVHEKIDQGLCDKYSLTLGLAELREEIALSLQKENLRYDPESEIIVTAGSIEGITASVLASTEPGDEVIVPSPTYASYRGSLAIGGCVTRYVELDEDNNFDFHVERVREAITRRTKAILYCSPNNPTGTLYSEAKTRAIIDLAIKNDLTVIIDEVYKDFYYTADKHFTPALIPEARDRVIRVCSFSKAFAMTGWRVGFVHADAARIRKILKFHDAMVTCAPVVSQYAAIAALRFGDPFLAEFKQEFKRRRDYAISMLDQLSHVLDYQLPRATYFVFPRIKDIVPLAKDSHKLAYDILEKARVAVVPGTAFGPSGESHIRMTYGKEMEDLQEAFHRLQDYFTGIRSKASSTPAANATPAAPAADKPLRACAKKALALASRIYLRRNHSLIVGIAGTRGKTVFKRTITELLREHFPTRANFLSYNTDIGLPLAILNLDNPRTAMQKAIFPLRLAAKALFGREREKVLVLEYGVGSPGDAKALLRIARPTWLVVSDIASPDPSINTDAMRSEIAELIKATPMKKVIWCAEDPLILDLEPTLDEANSVRLFDIEKASVAGATRRYPLAQEAVGRSAQLAIVAAVKLAERLSVPEAQIAKHLG
ncbi:MAG: aminotransferase class I/II-fold pyridoxal phosphate-dependent enzyme [Deltaproteobacteria bacterium]|nr:aminotransferase class I/II-fold pyridoxal phosphate-dependent enzyme [Deltaproteobacteria bacterium]